MSASVLSARPQHHDLGGPSVPTRAAPPPPSMPHSKSRELARALDEERLNVRAFRPPSAWGETDGEADVVWGGEHGYVPPPPVLLPSPGVSSAVSGEADRFSDAASWEDESAVDVASPRQLGRGAGRAFMEEEGGEDGPDFLAGLSGNIEDETLGDEYNDSRSTYGHARVSSVASSVWAGRGAPNATLGGTRKAPPPPLPDMALRAHNYNMAVPLHSPASVYSPGADGFGGRMPQWQSAGLPEPDSANVDTDEEQRLAADRDAGDTSGLFEMMNTRQSSRAPSRAPSSGAHGAQYERGVSPDGLDSSTDAPTAPFEDVEEDEADDVAPLGRAPSASSRKASLSSPQPNQHMMPPPPTTMPPSAKSKGRRNRSPVLSYDGGAEAEERLVALQAGPGDLQRMSSLGPRLKKNSPAPWELGDEEPAEETASIAAGRRPSATGSSDLAPPSRGFASSWGRQSGEGGRPRPSPRSNNQALPPVDSRASLASRTEQQQDIAAELAEYEAAAAAAAAANATSKRARSKSVSSQAAGMLKGLGLAASAAPANKKTGKFAKAFRREKNAPSVPSSSAANSLTGSHGSEDFRKAPTNLSLSAGISSDDYAHYASSPTGRASSPQSSMPAPPSPLSFGSASSPALAATANSRPVPSMHLASGGTSPAVPRSPSTSSTSPLPPAASSAAAIGPGRQSSSTTESHGNTSTSTTSIRSSGHTAATSPGVGPFARGGESAEQHLHAGSSTAPLNVRKQEHSPNTNGLGFQPVAGGLRSPAPLSTPRMSPASPGRPLPSSNTQPRLASVGYKRSSTFLADGVAGIARSPSGGSGAPRSPSGPSSPNGSSLGAQAGFTFPPNRSPQVSRSPSARSQDDRAAAEQDTRADSATPTAGKALNLVQPGLSSDGSVRSSPMPSPNGGQQLMPFSGQLHPSASSGDVSQMVPSGSVGGMSTMPSVGSHEGVPYKLISLEQARRNQERERTSSRPKEPAGHATTDYARERPPSSPDQARQLKAKKSGFLRMFGKEKNGSEHLSGDAWEGQPGMPSLPSNSSSLEAVARKGGSISTQHHMPSLAINGDGAAAATDENKGMAPALSLRPVSSMFAGFMPEMLDPASFEDKSKAASPASLSPSSDEASRRLLPTSPAVTARTSSSADSNVSRVESIGKSATAAGKSRIASARSAHAPAAIATGHSARSGSMRGSLKGSEVGSPGFQSASSHLDETTGDDAFHSPATSPTNGTFGSASADASRQSLGKHATQLRGQDSLRAPPHSRALPGSLPRPNSTASTHSDASSALGLVAGFPATPEISPATTPQLPAAVRTRAMAIEAAILELAAELTALRNSAEADGMLPPSPQPASTGAAIPSCASCGCNCAEQRRVQAVNEAAVLKGVSILNRTRALKPSPNGDVCSFGGYRDR